MRPFHALHGATSSPPCALDTHATPRRSTMADDLPMAPGSPEGARPFQSPHLPVFKLARCALCAPLPLRRAPRAPPRRLAQLGEPLAERDGARLRERLVRAAPARSQLFCGQLLGSRTQRNEAAVPARRGRQQRRDARAGGGGGGRCPLRGARPALGPAGRHGKSRWGRERCCIDFAFFTSYFKIPPPIIVASFAIGIGTYFRASARLRSSYVLSIGPRLVADGPAGRKTNPRAVLPPPVGVRTPKLKTSQATHETPVTSRTPRAARRARTCARCVARAYRCCSAAHARPRAARGRRGRSVPSGPSGQSPTCACLATPSRGAARSPRHATAACLFF